VIKETVKEIAASFKGSPACLAAIVLVGILAFLVNTAREHERSIAHEQFMKIAEKCLSDVPPSKRDFEGIGH